MISAILSTVGITIAAVGALLLFKFGLPFRNRTGGRDVLGIGGPPDEGVLAIERRVDQIGWLGFSLGLFGAVLQVTAVWMPSSTSEVCSPSAIIPAKAGTQAFSAPPRRSTIKHLGPRLRGDDEKFG